jgi:hypothetical protein
MFRTDEITPLRRTLVKGHLDNGVIRWLLDGDPAIRWQVLRDLVGASAQRVGRERNKVARWHYDILRALDHFRAVDAPRDNRLSDAIEIVRNSRGDDGRWPLQHSYRGKTYFELERIGAPSRWNTLRALRVLRWWERKRQR